MNDSVVDVSALREITGLLRVITAEGEEWKADGVNGIVRIDMKKLCDNLEAAIGSAAV